MEAQTSLVTQPQEMSRGEAIFAFFLVIVIGALLFFVFVVQPQKDKYGTYGVPKLMDITTGRLLHHNGIDWRHGNTVKSIRLVSQSAVRGSGVVIAGFGYASVSSSNQQYLKVGMQLMNGTIQFIYLQGIPVQIKPGTPKLVYAVCRAMCCTRPPSAEASATTIPGRTSTATARWTWWD